MLFEQFAQALRAHITAMCANARQLYVVDLDTTALWETYLNSFPPGTNNPYRERTEHDCSSCRHFIKSFGNVVAITAGKIVTIWDADLHNETYQPVVDSLAAFVRQYAITNVLVAKQARFGTVSNFEQTVEGTAREWHHLHAVLPRNLVTNGAASEATLAGQLRDTRNVFKRSLDEVSEESVLTILELVAQNSLYKGEEWQGALTQFLGLKREYTQLNAASQELYAWTKAAEVGGAIARIRNSSIGTLLQAISAGEDLDEAVRKYEAIVAPTNYKRPKAIFTKKMLEDAQRTLEELGLMDSLDRRHATLDDITVNNILFANRDAAKRISGSVFDEMAAEAAINPKSFSRVEEIPIQRFVEEVLPTTKNISVFVENRHAANLVSLVAPVNTGAPSLFKWGNGFSWAYAGNITDSMKQRVKSAGGNVEGVLRFSIQWNDAGDNQDDLDAHCITPTHTRIYFRDKCDRISHGSLDVDIIHPKQDQVAVENITWPSAAHMPEGDYQFLVHCYSSRGSHSGFSAEIEFDGQLYGFTHAKPLRQSEHIAVATVAYSRRDGFKLTEQLQSSVSQRTVWGVTTNQFQPVLVCMYSPNYWDKQDGIGHRHYFFMLKDAVNPESPNGFFNEYLKEAFMPQKRVFEALGSRMRVAETPEQLSGLGFSSTQPNSLILKVEGQTTRTLKVLF